MKIKAHYSGQSRESFFLRIKFFASLGLVLIFAICTSAQKKSTYKGFPSLVWPKLYDIKYIENAEDFDGLSKPVFSDAAKELNGKTVTIPGYLVPFENGLKDNHFMISSLPLNVCYFCGGGGPETVIEVFSIDQVNYSDKPVEIRGKLFLNDKDPSQMIYILSSAEVLGPVDF